MNRDVQTTVRSYYTACCTADPDQIRQYLADDLVFRSPQDKLRGVQAFVDTCVPYMQGLSRVEFLKELYDGGEAFVVLGWVADNGVVFHSAEHVQTKGGAITAITTINNDPGFWTRLHNND